MSVNLINGTIPFTELFERLMTLAKIDSFNNEDYAKGLTNDAYTRALPSIGDWLCIMKESVVTTSASYSNGTVAITAGATFLVGIGSLWTSDMTYDNGWRIKFDGQDNIYEFTYVTPTTANINPPLSGSTSLAAGTYKLFRDEYALPADFDRFLKNGSLYALIGGRLYNTIMELPRDQFREQFFPEPLDPIFRMMLTRVNSSGDRMIRVNPPPKAIKTYPIDYIPKIAPMKEYTTGTVSLSAGSQVVTGVGTYWAANVAAGDYFRIDTNGVGDSSKWYRVQEVTSNTSLMLTAAWGEGAEVGSEYTICTAPSSFPTEFHEFILYEAVSVAVASNADPNAEIMIARRGDVLNRLNKNYKGRRTNSQFGVEDDGYR